MFQFPNNKYQFPYVEISFKSISLQIHYEKCNNHALMPLSGQLIWNGVCII